MSAIAPTSNVIPSSYPTQSGSAYPLNIDGDITAFLRIAGNFAPRVESTPNLMMSIDPGHLFLSGTLTEIGGWTQGNVNSNITVNVTGETGGITVGQRIRAFQYVAGVITDYFPVGTIVTNVSGTTITVSQSANATATGCTLIFGSAVGGVCSGNTYSNTTVDTLPTTAHIFAGMTVSGSGIPSGTTVASVTSSTAITLSQSATATASGVTLTFGVPVPSSNPRIDRISVSQSTGAITWTEGTPGASPSPPSIPAGTAPVCQVYVATTTTALTMTSNIADERDLSSLGNASNAIYVNNSAPPSPVLGTLWMNTTTGPYPVSIYDGTDWLPVFYVDAGTHRLSPVLGGGVNTISSASTINIGTDPQTFLTISGTTTITTIDTGSMIVGQMKVLQFSGALTLTYNATSLILPGGANITTAAGDTAIAVCIGANEVNIVSYFPASGKSVVPSYTLASAADTLTGTSTTEAITPGGFAGNKSLGSSGYYKLPGGLTFQWGGISALSTGTAVTFPVAFANAVVSLTGGPTTLITGFAFETVTLSGFTVYVTSNTNMYWTAIGY